MNDYKEICETLRLANSWQFAPRYVEAMLKAADAIEQLVRERDAAVGAVAEHPHCYNCKHRYESYNEHPCIICNQIWPSASECKWQWRGVQEVEDA